MGDGEVRVLVACEFSGVVRDAFLARGHDAMSCDLLDTDSPGPHYKGDVRDVLGGGFDMMIAHPPCTYLSNAGARHLYPGGRLNPERYAKGLEAREFFMLLYNAPIPKRAIENPGPSSIFGLPIPSQVVQPYDFGHPYSKRTLLWLVNLPPLMSTSYIVDFDSTKTAGNWFNRGGKDRQHERARTFQGLADAMADQWGS
jgi:hypothetical protein